MKGFKLCPAHSPRCALASEWARQNLNIEEGQLMMRFHVRTAVRCAFHQFGLTSELWSPQQVDFRFKVLKPGSSTLIRCFQDGPNRERHRASQLAGRR